MNLKTMIIEYAKLSSAHFMFLTAVIPVTGAIAMGEKNLTSLTIIFFIGLSAHIYGFALNHYMDIEVDRLINQISKRPLVSGSISKRNAFIFIFLVFLSGFILTFYFYGIKLFLMYLIGIYLASIYDVYSKRISGMDFILAAAVITGVLFGAATVSFNFTNIVLIFCALAFLQTLNLNLIAGGVKDADHDYIFHSKHISTRLGVRVENGVFYIPKSFKFLAYLFGLSYALIVLIPVIFKIIKLHAFLFFILVGINVLFFIITFKMLNLKSFERQEVRKYVVLQYSINWLNIPILLMSVSPWAGLLICYPIFGLIISNILLYKTILRPQVM
jgi:4-hydroxybenzoate polyprenyltransferase